MPPSAIRNDAPLRQLAYASIFVFFSAVVSVTGFALWSATRSDELIADRQSRVVSYAIAEGLKKIPYDQESVAIWDDAVLNVGKAFDHDWVDVNLGIWLYNYFKHDQVQVLDRNNRALYTMAGGTEVPYRAPDKAVFELALRLRQEIASGALDRYERGEERIPRVAELAVVEGRPAIISVMPLVPETRKITQERGAEGLIVSARFLDDSFVSDLAKQNLLEGVRFSRTNDAVATERTYTLKTAAGATIGYLIWKPDLPGHTMLSKVLPILGAALLAIGSAIAFLIGRLRSTYGALLQSEAHAKHLAFHDALTSLPNRAFFNESLDVAIADERHDDAGLALMILDLDHFKQVNDTFGHSAGDELMRQVTARLRAALDPGDVLARMGGDEFALIKRGATSEAQIATLCTRIVAEVSKPYEVRGGQVSVGISIGVAIAKGAHIARSELMRKADIALYESKRKGRQQFQFYSDSMSYAMLERRSRESELRLALTKGSEFEIHYQPIYSATTSKICGVEALVRWNHPRLGLVAPTEFVHLAEECGLIDQLGAWVLREALTTARAWHLETIAVNVSALQLRKAGFATYVLSLLAEAGMSPACLEIEITESSLLDGSEVSANALNALRSAGVKVALDDFGTGYSSLSYLIKVGVDRIKIDRSFVQNVGECARSTSIVQAVVAMARAANAAVTAEGVETQEQQQFLALLGCNNLQGYLFSPPVPAEQITELLARERGEEQPKSTEAA